MTASDVHLIENDIAETRARLNNTINRIQDKLTVSGIVDEVMGQAGVPRFEAGHDFVLGFLRRHPVPVMVVAAGIGWFMYRRSRAAGLTGAIGDEHTLEAFPSLDHLSDDVPVGTYNPATPGLPSAGSSVHPTMAPAPRPLV